jgi:hypothetical protein
MSVPWRQLTSRTMKVRSWMAGLGLHQSLVAQDISEPDRDASSQS